MPVREVTPRALAEELSRATGERPILLDVRTADELRLASIQGAVHVPMNELPARLDDHGGSEASPATLTDASVPAAVAQMGRNFVGVHGGHLGAPKFPHCTELELLLDLSVNAARADAAQAPRDPGPRGDHGM